MTGKRMTIDEAKQYLLALKRCETCESNDANDCKTCEYHQKGSSAKCYDAIDVGVDTMHKYQKLERVHDKIKAEIDEHIEYNKRMNYMGLVGGLLLAKAVLDKYKAESEEAADDKEAD